MLMSPVLKEIPIAVLFGVFLYMGVASMSGITLLDRCLLVFMPEKHHPEEMYVKRVSVISVWDEYLFRNVSEFRNSMLPNSHS